MRGFWDRGEVIWGRVWMLFLVVGIVGLGAPEARAILDEAHTFAMEAAVPAVGQGFTVREDYWSGEIKSGEPKLIKHQLFKGNEYWFWLGSSYDGTKPEVKIYDEDGKLVQVEATKEAHMAAARVLPPETGTYFIHVVVESAKKGEKVDWALAYGYR
ncbi:MAG: T9SS type A sorting domain-containing protein [Verrucomicrobiota bacterium]